MFKAQFYAKALAVFVALFLASRFWGEFTINQSLLLGSMGAIGWHFFRSVRIPLEADMHFSPFWVRVSPRWNDLLLGLRLLDEDPHDFWEEVGQGSDHQSVLLRSIAFTILKAGRTNGIVYLNDYRAFARDVEIWEPIREIQIDGTSERRGWSPAVFVKSGSKGLEFGLTVNSRWWRTMCAEDESGQLDRIATDPDGSTENTCLKLALLPYSEFKMYLNGLRGNSWSQGRTEDLEAEAARAGWAREQMDSHLIGAPVRIEHRYFTVEHKQI